jgi:hypothetical protein
MVGLADLANEAGGVEDAAARLLERFERVTCGVENGANVDIEKSTPLVVRRRMEGFRRDADACVVVHRIQSAEASEHR